jgi:hypothetical protein
LFNQHLCAEWQDGRVNKTNVAFHPKKKWQKKSKSIKKKARKKEQKSKEKKQIASSFLLPSHTFFSYHQVNRAEIRTNHHWHKAVRLAQLLCMTDFKHPVKGDWSYYLINATDLLRPAFIKSWNPNGSNKG